MISKTKDIFEQRANIIPNWNSMTRSELCNKYLENVDNDCIADSYMAAIICKFWNLIGHSYYSQSVKIATEEDCYTWLIDSIMYVLDKHVWTDPSSSLYGDPNAPEKAINVKFTSTKINFFVASTRDKRKMNYNIYSFDQINDDPELRSYASEEVNISSVEDPSNRPDMYNPAIEDKVKGLFRDKDYFSAFTIDAIGNVDLFDRIVQEGKYYSVFSKNKLKRHLRTINEQYCQIFSEMYGLNYVNVCDATKYITNLSYSKMDRKVDQVLKNLSRDKEFISALRG